jgi:hypothetical protein
MAIPCRVAKGPRAEAVARIDCGATVQQLSGQAGTIFVRRRKQGERHLDGAHFRIFDAKPIAELLTALGIGGASYQCSAQYGDYARA